MIVKSDNFFDLTAFANGKITHAQIFVNNMVESMVGKGENIGYQYFFLFPIISCILSKNHQNLGLCYVGSNRAIC